MIDGGEGMSTAAADLLRDCAPALNIFGVQTILIWVSGSLFTVHARDSEVSMNEVVQMENKSFAKL